MTTSSPLVDYIRMSPNHSGPRSHPVSRITPHCVVGQLTAESLASWFAKPSTQASSNYGIDKDGRVAQFVPEDCRAWTSSSADNDDKSVTIECASDKTEPYAFRQVVFEKLIDLCVDICRRYGKTRLIWIPDRETALAYDQKQHEMLITVHRWFSATDCPGAWMMSHMVDLASTVTARLGGDSDTVSTTPENKTDIPDDRAAFIDSIAPACQESMSKTGVLASVSIAQAILESGWGKSELAEKAMALFGMKTVLSGNSWDGSVWPGLHYVKKTTEFDENGDPCAATALFRAYDDIGQSIADHAAYLAGARNGAKLRYDGIIGEKDPERVCEILMSGGYATDPGYKDKLMAIIHAYGLTKYDTTPDTNTTPASTASTAGESFTVRVNIDDLHIRKGPGTGYDSAGFALPGSYTITKTKRRGGRTWGKIRPVKGWICLDYTERI